MNTKRTTRKDTSVPDGMIAIPADTLKVAYVMAAMDYNGDEDTRAMLQMIGEQLYKDAKQESDRNRRLGVIAIVYEVSKLIDDFKLIAETSNDLSSGITFPEVQEYLSVSDVSIFELSDQEYKFKTIVGFLMTAGVGNFERIFKELDAYEIELKAKYGGMKK